MNSGIRPAQDLSAFSDLAPELAAMLVSVASDVALVVDEAGIIRNVALGGAEPVAAVAADWVGRAWVDTVTPETRHKIEDLLRDVAANGSSRLRQVSHPSGIGVDIPIAYSAVRLGARGPVLAVGRDLRTISAIQQRLVEAQQSMERDYWQRRHADTRYRLMFQIATDPVLVVDADSLRVLDANRAAGRLLGLPVQDIIGRPATASLHRDARDAMDELLADARASGRMAELEFDFGDLVGAVRMSVTPFRSEGASLLLVRARTLQNEADTAEIRAQLASLVERTQDAIVLTDMDGRILLANPGFQRLVQLPADASARGRALAEWLGGSGEVSRLLGALKEHGSAPLSATSVRGEEGQVVHVELSSTLLPDVDRDTAGFIIRVSHRSPDPTPIDPAVH